MMRCGLEFWDWRVEAAALINADFFGAWHVARNDSSFLESGKCTVLLMVLIAFAVS